MAAIFIFVSKGNLFLKFHEKPQLAEKCHEWLTVHGLIGLFPLRTSWFGAEMHVFLECVVESS